MPQTVEAQAFLSRIAQLPQGPGNTEALLRALQPSLDDEAELRKLFAADKKHVRLNDPYVGLVDIFDAPADIRTTRARVVSNEDDLTAQYILPLSEKQRRKDGDPAMVSSLEEFKKNWAIFSEGSLSQLTDWSNVVVAGGSIQACLTPLPESAKTSKRAMRKYFHNTAFPTSDVDVFLYGLTPEQAEAKMQTIYEAVRDSVPWDVTCVRTKHTVSIHSQYPYRSVQIVLRLYSSPAEILAGFDVDAPCCLYDGERVWANPRAIVAMMRQCNTVDMSRRSPSYEVRLAKYSARGFEIHVPNLRREDVDPTIFERSIIRVQGLARLLVLERLSDETTRNRYLADRRTLRARPQANMDFSRRRKRMKGDLKADADFGGLEMNDYDVPSLHIPYGPGWDARRIDKLVYQTDLGMNSPYNPKNKGRSLHRHPAFFGTMKECLEDCCEFCPEPKDEEERKLQEAEDESYVRGRIQFIQENPGRQSMSGSFNPIDEGEWSEQAYMGPTEKLFNAIVSGDRIFVARVISEGETDLDRRDHVGRTALHVAILSKEVDIACDLIDAGARMTSRLVDGRTALHLAAQLDLPAVVRKLLERSAINAEKAKEEEEAAKKAKAADEMEVDDEEQKDEEDSDEDADDDDSEDSERDSSEDDWSSDDGKKKKAGDSSGQMADVGQIPEDEPDVPDVFDVNLPDWDYAFTALHYAVASGSLGAIDELLAAGADPKAVNLPDSRKAVFIQPLVLAALTNEVDVAREVAKRLFAKGAISSEADDNLFTVFHKVVTVANPLLVDAFLQHDPNAKAVIDSPYMAKNCEATFPVVSAIAKGSYATLAVLLANGARCKYTEEDWSRARDLRRDVWKQWNATWQSMIYHPVEASLAQLDVVVSLLVNIGAEFDIGNRDSNWNNASQGMSILDYVRGIIPALQKDADALLGRADLELERPSFRQLAASSGWKGTRGEYLLKLSEADSRYATLTKQHAERRAKVLDAIAYFQEVETLLVSKGAKTLKELNPESDIKADVASTYFQSTLNALRHYRPSTAYYKMTGGIIRLQEMPDYLTSLCDELFEACSEGDNAKIEELCLPKDSNGKLEGKLLQITCRFGGGQYGITPLSVALQKRRWDTARLVLAIATAQYKPEEGKPAKFVMPKKFALDDDGSGDESDSDSDEDMDDDETEAINFVDIAQRPSQVQTNVPPADLLGLVDGYIDPQTKGIIGVTPLRKAIMENDFEAFVQIADLYKSLPTPGTLPEIALSWALSYDRPEMLDEIIRRTGKGIYAETPEEEEEETVDHDSTKPTRPPAKVYLGLNVHGKKRKDLAQKADPDAPSATDNFRLPILWEAAHKGAIGVLRYLATERPTAAYDYYAAAHSDKTAKYIRRIRDDIPQKLGWTSNQLNESVVTAAVIGNQLEVLKALVDLRPAEMQSALMSRINYAGFNHILVAAFWGCSPEMFDYLLSKGVSPTETDARGWNIFHILAAQNPSSEAHLALFKHVMEKLPDITSRLLLQQSKGALNTPLHIAAKTRSLPAAQLLLQNKAPMFTLRDRNGSTVLHHVVKNGLAEMTRLVAEASPTEALHMEDGVGITPLEIAALLWLREKTSWRLFANPPRAGSLGRTLQFVQQPREVSSEDVKLFRETIEYLTASGRLRTGTKLATELSAFVDKLDARAKKQAIANSETDTASVQLDARALPKQHDPEKTFTYISSATSARPGRRGLVHLIDVHRSVKVSIERSIDNSQDNKKKDDDMEEAKAESEDARSKKRSVVSHYWSPSVLASPFEDDTL
ncbi:ankyrin [Trametes sanguinea]|nr:ankyrin [Trametes sanguinea]